MNSIPTFHRQRGSMLLEGLMAILIFSMGVLALVGLQALSIKNSADAKYRVDASYLANQVIGQIWADRGNVGCYGFPAAGTCGSPASTANRDAWVASFASAGGTNYLPGADRVAPSITIGANNLVTVMIRWQAPKDPGPHNFVAVTQIN